MRKGGADGPEAHVVTIAVLSQKGGVGKTVTVTNLGVCLAERGQRVLMVDFDPQPDLSASWGLEDDEPHARVEQYLGVANADVGAALFEIPLGDDAGSPRFPPRTRHCGVKPHGCSTPPTATSRRCSRGSAGASTLC